MKNILKRIPGVMAISRKLGLVESRSRSRLFLLNMFPKGSIGAEIGVHKGDFSNQILRIVKPKELHLIDPWEHAKSEEYQEAWYGGKAQNGQEEMDARYEEVLVRFDANIRLGQVIVHRGYSSEVCNDFPDVYFDWIYIDGNHLYEFVKQDLELYYEKVKVSGYITGDNYKEYGWWKGGVRKAVDEFIENKPIGAVVIRGDQFILRKTK